MESRVRLYFTIKSTNGSIKIIPFQLYPVVTWVSQEHILLIVVGDRKWDSQNETDFENYKEWLTGVKTDE